MRRKKKIGVFAQYISTRHDIRKIAIELNKIYDVCVFLKKEDLIFKNLFPDSMIEFREIKSEVGKNIKSKIIDLSYHFFGKIPQSRGNYYITEHFKLYNQKFTSVNRFKSRLLLNLSKITPKSISYDKYLSLLKSNEETFIDDIDEFFCFTQIYDDLFFSNILESGKPTKVYVYSWDHPCKMKTFSKHVDQYLVWNEGLKDDLIQLQGIAPSKIRLWGSTQLCSIHEYLLTKDLKGYYDFDYFYFVCATGYPKLIAQEVNFICKIAEFLQNNCREIKLVVRTYPFSEEHYYYDILKDYDNIIIDNYKEIFDSKEDAEKIIMDKLLKVQFAKAILHFGTTLGLEAAYFQTPVIFLNFSHNKELNEFIHQFQNDKYLNLDFPNVVKNLQALYIILNYILDGKGNLLNYNNEVSKFTKLHSFAELAKDY